MSVHEEKSQEREISSGVIVFHRVQQERRFLMLYYGNAYWTFPRGKIEKEERSFAAALRETREETGLSRHQLRFVDYFKAYENWTFKRNDAVVKKTVIFYLAEALRKEIKVEPRCLGYVWATYEEAIKLLSGTKNSENRKVLSRVHEFLSSSRTHKDNQNTQRIKRRRFTKKEQA